MAYDKRITIVHEVMSPKESDAHCAALDNAALPLVLSAVHTASPFCWKLAPRANFYRTIAYVKVFKPSRKGKRAFLRSRDRRAHRLVLHIANGRVERVKGTLGDSGLVTIFTLYFACFHTS